MTAPRSYHLVTLGCPKNDVDSEHFERLITGGGLSRSEDAANADAIVVNTCGFIEQSQAESLEVIESLAAGKRPGQVIVVAGCLTQIRGREISERFPGVDHVLGVGQWTQVASLLNVDTEAVHDIPEGNVRVGGPSAYLKISDGCDAPCTFCVIPKIKGGLRSMPAGLLLKEAGRLVEAGAQELVLVGQDTTAWGEDLGIPFAAGLPDLLATLSDAVGPETWLRLMYAYPSRVTPALIEVMAERPNILPYLDVPLQHGSERILRAMKRPGGVDRTVRTLEELRKAMPEAVLRTSFIAGFPGETEADFDELLSFATEVEFDHAGCFTYSRQPLTPAFGDSGQVDDEIKEQRRDRFMRQQQAVSRARAARFVGRELQTIVEGTASGEDGIPRIVGRTFRDAPEVDGLVIAKGQARPGERTIVHVDEAGDYDLFGRVVGHGDGGAK